MLCLYHKLHISQTVFSGRLWPRYSSRCTSVISCQKDIISTLLLWRFLKSSHVCQSFSVLFSHSSATQLSSFAKSFIIWIFLLLGLLIILPSIISCKRLSRLKTWPIGQCFRSLHLPNRVQYLPPDRQHWTIYTRLIKIIHLTMCSGIPMCKGGIFLERGINFGQMTIQTSPDS